MHWILQENLFKESEWENLVGALERFNLPYSVHKVVPFVGELIPEVHNESGTKVICFGSYSLRHAAKKNGWTPGVYDLFDQNFEVQKLHWGDMLLNYSATVMPLRDANIPWDLPAFIRPIDDSKYFAGRVFEAGEWNTWANSIVDGADYGNGLTPDTKVQICRPTNIIAEWRYWIVDQKIITRSLYKRGGKVIYSNKDWDIPREADWFATTVLKTDLTSGVRGITLEASNSGWRPADAFVLDICQTADGFKIVEINTINSAGFYAANITDLVLALEELNK